MPHEKVKWDYQVGVSPGSGSVPPCVLATLAFRPRCPDRGTGAGAVLKHLNCSVVEVKKENLDPTFLAERVHHSC